MPREHCRYAPVQTRRSAGVGLIELLVTVSLAALLLTLAVPAFDAQMNASRLGSASNTLLSSLLLARSEAIKRNARVVVCKSADGLTCTASGHWEQGWIAFHDTDNDAQLDASEAVIARVQALPADISLRGNTHVAHYVSYTPTGSAKLVNGAFQAGTLTACRISGNAGESRQVIISATGRPRVQKATAASCP